MIDDIEEKLKEQFALVADMYKGCQLLDCVFAGFACRKSCAVNTTRKKDKYMVPDFRRFTQNYYFRALIKDNS